MKLTKGGPLKGLFLLFDLWLSCSIWANSDFVTSLKQAEKRFEEKLYSDASTFYLQALTYPTEDDLKEQLTLRLVTCYLEEKKTEAALALLSPIKQNQSTKDSSHCLFLMSRVYRQLGEPSQAWDLLQQCYSKQNRGLVALEQAALSIDMGKEFPNSSFISENSHSDISFLVQLHQVKAHLLKRRFDTALEELQCLSERLPTQHPLNKERIYLTGWLLLSLHRDSEAASCFETLLPEALNSHTEGATQIIQGIIISYLRQSLTIGISQDRLETLLSKTEAILPELLARRPAESSFSLLSDFYLIKSRHLNDANAYIQVKQLFEKQVLSDEGRREALLKIAAAGNSYLQRHQLYEDLLKNSTYPQQFYGRIWFFNGLNDFEEALCQGENPEFFQQAAHAFAKASQLMKGSNSPQEALALKYQALAHAYQPGLNQAEQAWKCTNELMSHTALISTFECPKEIDFLSGWIALKLGDLSPDGALEILQKARDFLQKRREVKDASLWSELCIKLEGLLCLKLKEWEAADTIFSHLIDHYPKSSFQGEAWFWRAYGAEKQNSTALKKEYLERAYSLHPESPFAPIAYFHLYSYQEYVQGQKKAIKHLQEMPLLFPDHYLLINTYYLIGLQRKNDHYSEAGKLLFRKDWTGAIEAFHLTESTFDSLLEKDLIPASDISYYAQIRYQAQLERGQLNFAIAKSSQGGKRQIYLDYAESVFKAFIHEFTPPYPFVVDKLVYALGGYPKVLAEAEFILSQIYTEKNMWEEAESTLNQMLEHYRQAKIEHSYLLSRVWYEKGRLAKERKEEKMALGYFIEAEKRIDTESPLSPNEKLDLWIQQSLCHKALNQLDASMKLLSRVINDEVISPLRIKAMVLRADIYEIQARPELAMKQLEAAAKRGGEWGQKAQQKLEQSYGF